MGIRSKILLAFLLCFGLVGWLSLHWLQRSMDAEFDALERVDLADNVGRVVKVLDASLGALRSLTRDWSEWSDMYQFAQSPVRLRSWIDQNVNLAALETADLSLIAIWDAKGNTVREAHDAQAQAFAQIPAALRQQLVRTLEVPGAVTQCGLLALQGHTSLLCAGRISRSDRSGDFVGVVLMGRVLDAQRILQWQEQTGFRLGVQSDGEVPPRLEWWPQALPPHPVAHTDLGLKLEPELVTAYAQLSSLEASKALTLVVYMPRELHARAQNMQSRVVIQATLSAVGIALLLAAAVHWLLVRRLRQFAAQMQDLASAGAWERRIRVRGRDELGALAAEVNLMLEMIEDQVKSLTVQSMTDILTGLPNRRAFEMRLLLEFGRARRQGQPLALLVVDVDYFKRFNDHYGHLAGDQALRAVAEVLAQSCGRAVDMAARLGGEEFVVMLPTTPMEGAVDIAQRVQRQLLQRALVHADSEVSPWLTVSIGIACIDGRDESAHALVARADRALYVAKQQGRNRFHCDVLEDVQGL